MRLGLTHMGSIDIAVKAMARRLNIDLVATPPTTQRTLSLGVKYSPETVCLPFKIQLGNMIESIETGADTVVMPGGPGPCRFGYYHKVHERILRDLGYEFQMITQEQGILNIVKSLTEGIPTRQVAAAFHFGIAKLKAQEELERKTFKVRAIADNKSEVTRIYKEGIKAIDGAANYRDVGQVKRQYLQKLQELPTATWRPPLKVGITGEIFIVIDPFANMDIETELGKLGIEVSRTVRLSEWVSLNLFMHFFKQRERDTAHRAARPYVSGHIGGDGWQTVGEKVMHARDWDGIVHLEPFGCVPEIIARNIMPSTREQIPVLNIIYDEHTGKTGLISRLEAFTDMIKWRKRRQVAVCV